MHFLDESEGATFELILEVIRIHIQMILSRGKPVASIPGARRDRLVVVVNEVDSALRHIQDQSRMTPNRQRRFDAILLADRFDPGGQGLLQILGDVCHGVFPVNNKLVKVNLHLPETKGVSD
jgi:hypothetical protein